MELILGKSFNNWINRSDCRITWALWPKVDKAGIQLLLGLNKIKLWTIIGILADREHSYGKRNSCLLLALRRGE